MTRRDREWLESTWLERQQIAPHAGEGRDDFVGDEAKGPPVIDAVPGNGLSGETKQEPPGSDPVLDRLDLELERGS